MKQARRAGLAAIVTFALGGMVVVAAAAPGPGERAGRETEEGAGSLAAIDQTLTHHEAREKALTAELDDLGRRAIRHGRAYTRLARSGLLAATGGFDAFVSHALHLGALRRTLVHDATTLRERQQEQRTLTETRAHLMARRQQLLAHSPPLAERSPSPTDDAPARQAAFDRAFSSSSGPKGSLTVYGPGITAHEPSPRRSTGAGFAALRGRLPFPVAGRTDVTPARRESANGPGVELRTSRGAAVHAVATGRVAFTAEYGDYGRMVILDHGHHYFTVTANLDVVDVRVGDDVSAGAPLGNAGDSPLYFELRHGSETLDPRPWLGLSGASVN